MREHYITVIQRNVSDIDKLFEATLHPTGDVRVSSVARAKAEEYKARADKFAKEGNISKARYWNNRYKKITGG